MLSSRPILLCREVYFQRYSFPLESRLPPNFDSALPHKVAIQKVSHCLPAVGLEPGRIVFLVEYKHAFVEVTIDDYPGGRKAVVQIPLEASYCPNHHLSDPLFSLSPLLLLWLSCAKATLKIFNLLKFSARYRWPDELRCHFNHGTFPPTGSASLTGMLAQYYCDWSALPVALCADSLDGSKDTMLRPADRTCCIFLDPSYVSSNRKFKQPLDLTDESEEPVENHFKPQTKGSAISTRQKTRPNQANALTFNFFRRSARRDARSSLMRS